MRGSDWETCWGGLAMMGPQGSTAAHGPAWADPPCSWHTSGVLSGAWEVFPAVGSDVTWWFILHTKVTGSSPSDSSVAMGMLAHLPVVLIVWLRLGCDCVKLKTEIENISTPPHPHPPRHFWNIYQHRTFLPMRLLHCGKHKEWQWQSFQEDSWIQRYQSFKNIYYYYCFLIAENRLGKSLPKIGD